MVVTLGILVALGLTIFSFVAMVVAACDYSGVFGPPRRAGSRVGRVLQAWPTYALGRFLFGVEDGE